MIEIKHLTMAYSQNNNVLSNVDLVINIGDHVVVFGEEGSGKTTLLRVILGLEKDFSGKVKIFDKDIKDVDFAKDVKALYISSHGAFLEGKSAYKNIEYVLKLRKQLKDNSEIEILSKLKQFGIYNYRAEKAKKLGKYNRLMLELARASFRESLDFVCIDDVFDGFSEGECEQAIKQIKSYLSEHTKTWIITTSNLNVAKAFGGKLIKMKLGSIENEN